MKTKHRIAAQHKRTQRDEFAMAKTISRMSTAPLSQQEQIELALPARVAWEAIKTGKGSGVDLRTLSEALSICVIAAEKIDPFLEETSLAAAMAICSIADRYGRIGRLGVDAVSLRDIPPALEFYDELLKTATSGQLFQWVEKVIQARQSC